MKDVMDLIEGYRARWQTVLRETRNVDSVNEFFHLPCFFIGGDGSVSCFPTADDISAFHRPRLEQFLKGGVATNVVRGCDVLSLGARSALAIVNWEFRRADDSIERAWRHSYNVVKTDAGWKIVVSTFQAGS
jgi:hypothetical protein